MKILLVRSGPIFKPFYRADGWMDGWKGYLPFGTLDNVRTIFFMFQFCKVSGKKGDVLKSV